MITVSVEFEMTWRQRHRPDPRTSAGEMAASAARARAANEEAERELARSGSGLLGAMQDLLERFGATPGAPPPGREPGPGNWNWPDARFIIAECLGAHEPAWDNTSLSWWQNHDHGALDWVRSPADVARIKTPDWPRTSVVERMLAAHERWVEAFPDDPGWATIWYLTLPEGYRSPRACSERSRRGGEAVAGTSYPSFVDLGIFLFGTTRFLTILGGERELADALLDKCFELSCTYSEFMQGVAAVPWEALITFGGDVSCMLSPRLYPRYGLAWDQRLFEHVTATHAVPADLPCNLHSCGPSVHLYDFWGQHPCLPNITTMQTRLVPGHVGRLRRNLPATLLQLTFHPQHFDIAQAAPAEFKRVVRESAHDAGYRDLHFTVFAVAQQPGDLPRLAENLRAMHETLQEIEEEHR